jgi:hypothetical protein
MAGEFGIDVDLAGFKAAVAPGDTGLQRGLCRCHHDQPISRPAQSASPRMARSAGTSGTLAGTPVRLSKVGMGLHPAAGGLTTNVVQSG